MLFLQPSLITDLYVMIDDLLPRENKHPGRPSKMTDGELVCALVWNSLTVRSKTIKDLHNWLLLYHQGLYFAPGDVHDSRPEQYILNEYTRLLLVMVLMAVEL
ncbi:MAG TPA: hypothetical protein PK263_00965 [bacterium]|nr:hypothetical protein [bacterium]